MLWGALPLGCASLLACGDSGAGTSESDEAVSASDAATTAGASEGSSSTAPGETTDATTGTSEGASSTSQGTTEEPTSSTTEEPIDPPPPSCAPAPGGASGEVQAPTLVKTLPGSWDENWLASPALVDLNGDGGLDIVAARHSVLYVYDQDGAPLWQTAWAHSASDSPEHGSVRMWPSAAVGDLDGDGDVEIVVSAHPDDSGYNVAIYDHAGELLPGWPQAYGDAEVRSVAAADVDGDGQHEILITKQATGPATSVFELDGSLAAGWPQVGECAAPEGNCIDYGGFNQNIGAGDLDGDGVLDVVSTYDAIGFGAWKGDGTNLPAHDDFADSWVTGVEAYHDLELAMQGWGTGDRSEFTYSPPVIADIDGDGDHEVVLGGDHEHSESTENQGVSVWVLNHDMTRPAGWEWPKDSGPPQAYGSIGHNIVPTYPAPSVADLDGEPGLEIVIPAYDGSLYAYRSSGELMWTYSFGQADPFVGASEALIVDLNGDGGPEILFTTFSEGEPKTPLAPAHLVVLDAGGNELHKIELFARGSMAAPSVGDLDGDGALELVISLKDAIGAGEGGVQIWSLPGASSNCVLWGTGRGNWLRQGYVPSE